VAGRINEHQSAFRQPSMRALQNLSKPIRAKRVKLSPRRSGASCADEATISTSLSSCLTLEAKGAQQPPHGAHGSRRCDRALLTARPLWPLPLAAPAMARLHPRATLAAAQAAAARRPGKRRRRHCDSDARGVAQPSSAARSCRERQGSSTSGMLSFCVDPNGPAYKPKSADVRLMSNDQKDRDPKRQ